MELRRYFPILMLILFVWVTIIIIFIIIDAIIVPWEPPQVTFWTIISYFTFPFSFDQGQLRLWSSIGDILQVVFSGLLVLLWLYTWYKFSKKLFWREMQKEKLT